MIDMIEPETPEERAIAIRICRANAMLRADTGEQLKDWDKSREQWRTLRDRLPYRKWIWMWNHGRAEWDPAYTAPEVSEQ